MKELEQAYLAKAKQLSEECPELSWEEIYEEMEELYQFEPEDDQRREEDEISKPPILK